MALSYDVCSLGDALVDFLPSSPGKLLEVNHFTPQLGGAGANVAVGLARLGKRAIFRGVVGDDELGHGLVARLEKEGLTARVRFTEAAPTGFAFVTLDAAGDREFHMPVGVNSADKRLTPEDIDEGELASIRWLHCGTVIHQSDASRAALLKAVRESKARGVRVSFDPNIRLGLWPDRERLVSLVREVLSLSDLIKLSHDELELCTGETSPEAAIDALLSKGASLVCVTLGADGALAGRDKLRIRVRGEPVKVVDTTGAGDGFASALLSRLCNEPLEEMTQKTLQRHLTFACWAGGRVCTEEGAVAGLPRAEDVPVALR